MFLKNKETNSILKKDSLISQDIDIAVYLHVSFKSLATNLSYIVEYGTTVEQNKDFIELPPNCHLVLSGASQEIAFEEAEIIKPTVFVLHHTITVTGKIGTTLLVERGMTLGDINKLTRYFDDPNLFEVSAADDPLLVYNRTEKVLDDMSIVVTEYNGKSSTPAIAASVVCAIVVVVAAVLVIIVVLKRKKKNSYDVELGNIGLFSTMGSTNSVLVFSINNKETELQLTSEIGRGTFGTVWKAQGTNNDSNTEYTVKVINKKSGDGVKDAQKEATLMEQLDTQFVVAVYGSTYTDTTMAIAMEYFPLGSLQNVLQAHQLSDGARVPMLLDIAKAMTYLHSKGIIHRDLKPGNVLVCSIDPFVHPMAKFVSFFFQY